MISKFEGSDGKRLLIDALMEQPMVSGNRSLAELFADVGELFSVAPKESLISQGDESQDVFLIISGSFEIRANGQLLTSRLARSHVGEMAALEPTQRRSATVTALEPSVVLRITEPQLSIIAAREPEVWRSLARELSRRLLQRNDLLTTPRDRPRIFVISSSEAIEVARAVDSGLSHDPFDVKVWNEGVFRISDYSLEALEGELDVSDFAIAIVAPDDTLDTRGARWSVARDNVTFELGLFMGRLGRHRTVLLQPRNDRLKLPSDLAGLTTLSYLWESGVDAASKFAPTCNSLREHIRRLGPRV